MDELEKWSKIIGENTLIRRKAAGLTQDELASKAGLAKGTIYNIENGKSENVTINSIISIAKALDAKTEEIIFPNGNMKFYEEEDLKTFEDEACEIMVNDYEKLRTYFPPADKRHQITSMIELIIALPLIDLDEIYRILSYISGDLIDADLHNPCYASEQFEREFNAVPNSPAKRFAIKEIEMSRKRRGGEDKVEDYLVLIHDEKATEEYHAYKNLINEKYQNLLNLKYFVNKNIHFS